jgi:hypothetical protein
MRTIPTSHLNGTSRVELDGQYEKMIEGINVAIHAMAEATPHGRDYYVGPVSYDNARAQHVRRWQILADLKKEITEDFHAFLVSTGR